MRCTNRTCLTPCRCSSGDRFRIRLHTRLSLLVRNKLLTTLLEIVCNLSASSSSKTAPPAQRAEAKKHLQVYVDTLDFTWVFSMLGRR